MSSAANYTVHLHPPAYPAGCFPSRCDHEPQFVMLASVEIVHRKRGGNVIETDHAVCLACGSARPCTVGGNIFVDLQMLWQRVGFQAQIGTRILAIREKWARIATYLFDENGWNGRHERVARMIDPNLTMKLRIESVGRDLMRVARVSVDDTYLRPAAE